MGLFRLVSIGLALVAITSLTVGGLGFSSMTADRGIQVSVVEDDRAFVGYEGGPAVVESGERAPLVTVTNRFPSEIDVTNVSIQGTDGMSIDAVQSPTDIDPGEEKAITGEVTCEESTTTDVAITVWVAGDAVSAELDGKTRSFELACQPPDPTVTGVYFIGGGSAKVSATEQRVNASVWVIQDDEFTKIAGYHTINASEPVRGQISGGEGSPIVAISFPDDGYTFVHPNLDVENRTLKHPSKGGEGVKVADFP